MRLVFDVETDGLYDNVTIIHCAVFKCLDTNRIWKLRKPESIVKMLQNCTFLVGHNIIDYDIPVIHKLTGYEYTGEVFDTIVMSRELFRHIQVPTQMKEDYKEKGKRLDGTHSLAAWGYRFNMAKVENEDWSVFTAHMLQRCIMDVNITHKLYEYIQKKWNKDVFPEKSAKLTFAFLRCISKQQKHGWKLDVDRCNRYINQLERWVGLIDRVIEPRLPYVPIIREDRTEEGFKNPFTQKGTLHANLIKWMDKNDIKWTREMIGGPFCRISMRKVNLESNDELKAYLLDMGWQPEEYNYSKTEKDENGNPVRLSPKLNADDAFIGVDGKMGKLLCKRVQCRHRQSNIKGWVERVREDGRLESRISGFADTYRVKHANIANVPNAESFYGKQMRKCFIAEEGMVLVSADASSCQDRMLISRARDAGITDEVFEDMILNGDKKKGTDSHTRAMQEINKVFNASGITLITRGGAKNFNYAYKFNAGDKKLGTMAGVVNDAQAKKLGADIRTALDNVFKAQVELEKHLKKEWMESAKSRTRKTNWGERTEWYDGKVRGLDGRKVLIKKEKDILVFMLQSDEALTMQLATVFANKMLEKRFKEGVDYRQVCFYHDEYTFECKPEIAHKVKRILEHAINKAGKYFKLSIEQTGEGEIGDNWYSVH